MRVLLFGGTSEGRELALWLQARGVHVTVCVATGYGAALAEGLDTHTGRLDAAGMAALMAAGYDCVIDATHPYAVEATENIRTAAQRAGLRCLRLVRDGDAETWPGAVTVPDMAAAAAQAGQMAGNILLTTGSKELAAFAQPPALRARCYPRVLPSLDSLRACLELGFPQKQVLCMQGPFSKALNEALIRQYDIRILVTKASGSAGGFAEKAAAAAETGCTLLVVARPVHEQGLSPAQLKRLLETEWEAEEK